ncbi:MAG: T9SS type A sorting domain-containing protein [Saprospiraceae bacterium]|nr:T9SS type A sorting domain-containing protein [Saprospiraceae bacterium]
MRVFVLALLPIALSQTIVAQSSYTETLGNVSGIVTIAAHEAANNFDIDLLTYSGSGDVRNSAASNGYPGASGSANVLLNAQFEDLVITGLTPNEQCVSTTLTFGVRKSRNNENGAGFAAEYSTDGGNSWTSAGAITLPTGAGTIGWYQRTLSGLPGNANAYRFRKTSFNPGSSFRVDDIIIQGNGAGCSLPIELATFEVKASPDRSVNIHWATASERNNDFFTVEHATDLAEFSPLARIEGAGTTTEWQDYEFRHDNPAPGRNYYRLKQTDFDGAFTYSSVRSINFPKEDQVQLFPSPAVDKLQVRLKTVPAEPVRWEVYDAAGRLAQSGEWTSETTDFELDVRDLPPGNALLRLTIGREVLVKQFSRQ